MSSVEVEDDSSLREEDLPSVEQPQWKGAPPSSLSSSLGLDDGQEVSFPLLFAVLVLVVVLLQAWHSGTISRLLGHRRGKATVFSQRTTPEFVSFQRSYIAAYILAVTADWLQGPWLYALYEHYEFDKSRIGFLFVAGYMSSMVFGTVAGSLADRYGRRRACMSYCILYGVSCLTKHSRQFGLLLAGRVLGGISTSIIFSSFESWMIAEHNSRGFPQEWLPPTFAMCQLVNGLAAIFAGLLGAAAVQITGSLVAPFDVAIVMLSLCFLVISTTWPRLIGASQLPMAGGGDQEQGSAASKIGVALRMLRKDPSILILGLVQSSFEAAMYVFVFLWTPVLEADFPLLPHGQVFGCFMAALMIGSTVADLLLPSSPSNAHSPQSLMRLVLAAASLSLCFPSLHPHPLATLACFIVFEACVGAYYPLMGVVKSRHVPEEARATVYSLFRVPLNLAVALVLSNLKTYTDQQILACSAALIAVAALLQHRFCGLVEGIKRRQSSPLN